MKNSSLKVLSRHTSLIDAVKAAGLDLSYNEALALSDIERLDSGSTSRSLFGRNYLKPVTEAFVTDDGVYYTLECDLRLLNKYEPFHGCLHDGKFMLAVETAPDTIRFSDGLYSDRGQAARFQINMDRDPAMKLNHWLAK